MLIVAEYRLYSITRCVRLLDMAYFCSTWCVFGVFANSNVRKAAYRPYAGPGKTLLPPGLMSPADPYGMMHHHVPDHLRPYMAQQPGLPMPMTPHAPSAYPMGAYASLMHGDSDNTSSEE